LLITNFPGYNLRPINSYIGETDVATICCLSAQQDYAS
jgi:hypothetical protein